MSNDTVILIIGIVGCVIGVLTYIGSIQTKSKSDGIMQQKLDHLMEEVEKLARQNDRLVIVEQSLKAVWYKVDEYAVDISRINGHLQNIDKRCIKLHPEK